MRSNRWARSWVVATTAAVSLLVAGCSGAAEDPLARAQAEVAAREQALADAQEEATATTEAFCGSASEYITALDRYGDVLTDEAPTVGDVVTAGTDLREPRQDVLDDAEAAQQARVAVAEAQDALGVAQAELAALEASTTSPAPVPTEPTPATPVPVAPAASVERVRQADADLTAAQRDISENTPLVEASEQFNAAAVALEMAWLRLVADTGCLTDEQQAAAQESVRAYTAALQQSLTDAGYYAGSVDGIYGPDTVAAVEALQEAHGLPVTGAVDKATDEALRADLAAKGDETAQAAVATTAALQQTLHLLGYWDGPVDGAPSDALTQAVMTLQTDLGVEPTGAVDAATIAAFHAAVAEAQEPDEEPTEEPTEDATG